MAIVGLLAQISGLLHFVGDALFPHGAEVTASCPDEHEGVDCPPGCPACHACEHRQTAPASPLSVKIPPRLAAFVGAECVSIDSPKSPPSMGVYRPPRS